MTHSIDTPTQSGATNVSTDQTSSTADVAKDQARNVGQTAAQAGTQVASTAADQAKQVTQETKRQAQDLIAQGRTQVTGQLQEQARTGQQKASQGLTEIASQLRTMVDGSGQTPSGPAADLVRQAGDKVEEIAGWLQDREPGDLVTELRSYARRRPGVFLFGAAVAGIVAGRLTTGVVAAHKDNGPDATGQGTPRHAVAGTPQPGTNYADTTYAAAPTAGYAGGTTGYATTGTAGSVPPPPYGTVPAEGTSVPTTAPAGWNDPARTSGEGRL